MRRIILFLLLALAILILLLLLGRCDGGLFGRRDCFEDGKHQRCEARLALGRPGVSVWPDGTIAVAVPLENRGGRGAGSVTVTKLTLASGARIDPVSFPVALGEIAPKHRGVIQAEFTTLSVPGDYLLTVKGSYVDHGKTRPFDAKVHVPVKPNVDGVIMPVTVVLPKQRTSGTPLPAQPIKPEVEDNNPVGPPLPKGPRLTPFAVAPTSTPVTHAPPAGGTAGGITFQHDTGSNFGINSAPPDPSVVVVSSANLVMETDNVVMNYSVDDGKTFTSIDPTTIFPSSDGGMCCDQVLIYDKAHDLVFWLQQYNTAAAAGSTNRLRVAWATPASIKANPRAWTYVDLTQPGFSSGGGLDYPDLAITGSYLYVSIDGTDTGNTINGLIVARLSLSDIAGGAGNVSLSYLGPNQSTDLVRAHGSHLSQNSPDGVYWAGGIDGSDMEVFHWADSAGTVPPHNATINSWCSAAADYANLPPDKMQWPDTGHLGGAGNIVAATRKLGTGGAHGQVWFGWGAGADNTSECSQSGRPTPFVKIVQIDDTTLDSVGEYHIWNSAYAFSYPSLATDPSGNIGVSVAFAGPSNYPSTTVGYLGDFTVYYVEASTVSLKFYTIASNGNFTFTFVNDGTLVSDSKGNPIVFTRYGDYFSVRNSGSDGSLFSAQGYAVSLVDATKSTTCLTSPGCTYHPHYEQWGRPAPPPIK